MTAADVVTEMRVVLRDAAGDEHHALMRRHGIPAALTPGGPPGGY